MLKIIDGTSGLVLFKTSLLRVLYIKIQNAEKFNNVI